MGTELRLVYNITNTNIYYTKTTIVMLLLQTPWISAAGNHEIESQFEFDRSVSNALGNAGPVDVRTLPCSAACLFGASLDLGLHFCILNGFEYIKAHMLV